MKFKNLLPIIIILVILSAFSVDALVQNFYVDVNMREHSFNNVSRVSIGNNQSVPATNWLNVVGNTTGGNVWFYREGTNSSGLNFGMNPTNGIAEISSYDNASEFKKLNIQGSSIGLNIDTTPALLINSSLGSNFYSDVIIDGKLNVTGTTYIEGLFKSYGNVFIDDIGGSTHHINVDLENLDELYANVFLTPLQINTSYNASGSYVNILAEQGEASITVNIGNSTGSNNYRLQYNNLSLQLTPGTNESPILNRVYVYLNAGVPTWTVSTTEPTVKHAMVARILLGAVDEDPVAASLQEDGQVGHLKRTQRRFRKEGLLYEDGFDYNATSTDLSIGLGGYINGIYDLDTTKIPTVSGGFYQVLNNGSYVYYDSFDDIVEYSDGNTIGTNKYFNVIFGITPYDSTGRIYAVVQSKPATEYTSTSLAYGDNYNTVAVYPSEDFLKITFLPIARMIINEGGDAQVLPSGLYAIDYRGGIAGGVASGGGLSEQDPVWTIDKPSYVPYTGATTDLDLGAHALIVNSTITAAGNVYGVSFIDYNSPSNYVNPSSSSILHGGITINNGGLDSDTVINGDTVNSLLHVNAGTDKVGIGTSAPKELLQVGSASSGTDAYIMLNANGGGYNAGIGFIGGSTGFWGLNYSDSLNDFSISENGERYLTVLSGGKVGIGTATPNTELDVVGNLSINSNNAMGSNSTCTVIMSPGGTGILNICD